MFSVGWLVARSVFCVGMWVGRTRTHAHARVHSPPPTQVYEALGRIDSRKATAREKKDLDAINAMVAATATHAGLNKLANKEMRRWLVETALGEEARLQEAGGGKPLFAFQRVLCIMLLELGELAEAERAGRASVAGREGVLGPMHNHTLSSVAALASVLQEQGKLDEAEPLLRRALAGSEERLGAFVGVCVGVWV